MSATKEQRVAQHRARRARTRKICSLLNHRVTTTMYFLKNVLPLLSVAQQFFPFHYDLYPCLRKIKKEQVKERNRKTRWNEIEGCWTGAATICCERTCAGNVRAQRKSNEWQSIVRSEHGQSEGVDDVICGNRDIQLERKVGLLVTVKVDRVVGGGLSQRRWAGGGASASSARKRNDAQRCAVLCCAVATATVKDVRARCAAPSIRQRQRATVKNYSNSSGYLCKNNYILGCILFRRNNSKSQPNDPTFPRKMVNSFQVYVYYVKQPMR